MISMFFAFGLSAVLGYQLVRAISAKESSPGYRMIELAIGIISGFGVSSCIFFICFMIFAPNTSHIMMSDICLHLIFIGALSLFNRIFFRNRNPNPIDASSIYGDPSAIRFIKILALVFLVSSITYFLIALQVPYGGHDAMGIWNIRARIMALPQPSWLSDLQTAGNHPDYPLLVSGNIGRLWLYMDQTSILAPFVFHYLVTFATCLLLVSAIWRVKHLPLGILAGLILMGTPFFLRDGAEAQNADITMSFLILAVLVLLTMKDALGAERSDFAYLAGLCASLAAWTKNEGLLFLVCLLCIRFLIHAYLVSAKVAFTETVHLLLGMAPVLGVLIYFKISIASTSDLIAGQGFVETITKITDPSRHVQIFAFFVKEMFSFGRWQVYPFLMILYLFWSGTDMIDVNKKLSVMTASGIIVVMLAGFFIVYLTTYLDLYYHLRTSFSRLLLQIWPATLFAFFLVTRDYRQDPLD